MEIKIYNVRYFANCWAFDGQLVETLEVGEGRKVKAIIDFAVVDNYLQYYTIHSDVSDVKEALFVDEYRDFVKKSEELVKKLKEILKIKN